MNQNTEKFKKIEISIITISYNQSSFLKECLESVKRQAYPWLQHIVIDGGSNDGSIDILKKHSSLNLGYDFVWLSEKDKGPADALNKGFRIATGQVFGFLNSDDLLLPGSLQIVSSYFKGKDIKIIQGSGLIVDADAHLIRPVASIPFTVESFLARKHVIFQPSIFFRSEVYEAVGGFNIENKTSWDAEFFVDCCLAGYQLHGCPEVLSAFRLYEGSKSGSGEDSEVIKKDRARMINSCLKAGVEIERCTSLKKFKGWLMSMPYMFLVSLKWAWKYGVSHK